MIINRRIEKTFLLITLCAFALISHRVDAQQKVTIYVYPNTQAYSRQVQTPSHGPVQPVAGQYTPVGTFGSSMPSGLPAYLTISGYSYTPPPATPAISYYRPSYPVNSGAYGYQSIYSSYYGLPTLIYGVDSGVDICSAPPVLFDNGTFYPLSNDPYGAGISYTPFGSNDGSETYSAQVVSAVPAALQQSLGDISSSWVSNDVARIDTHLSSTPITVVNGNSSYSLNANSYHLMTRDAIANLKTTAFRFTGVRLQASGDAVAYGVQDYQARSGAQSKMYLAYLLHKDSAVNGTYSIRGMETSAQPLTGQSAR